MREEWKEKWREFQALLEEITTMKKREFFLTLAVCALSGLVVGMLISPNRSLMIGSHNGNNSGNEKEKKPETEREEK